MNKNIKCNNTNELEKQCRWNKNLRILSLKMDMNYTKEED